MDQPLQNFQASGKKWSFFRELWQSQSSDHAWSTFFLFFFFNSSTLLPMYQNSTTLTEVCLSFMSGSGIAEEAPGHQGDRAHRQGVHQALLGEGADRLQEVRGGRLQAEQILQDEV